MTGADHEHYENVVVAAHWLAEQQSPPDPVIANLRQRFSLSAKEACEAAALAGRFRTNRQAHG
jgi:hypothetical protein